MRVDIIDRTIETVSVDFSVTLGLSGGTEVRIETPFEISRPEGSPMIIDPEGTGASRPAAHALQGHAIVRAEVEDESGTLVIALGDGTELRVPADTDFEAWSVTGVDGAAVVALPGGGIGRWDSNGRHKEQQ